MEATLKFKFDNKRAAEIGKQSLDVDGELHDVRRTMRVEAALLVVEFAADDAKSLRQAINGFFEMAAMVEATLARFQN